MKLLSSRAVDVRLELVEVGIVLEHIRTHVVGPRDLSLLQVLLGQTVPQVGLREAGLLDHFFQRLPGLPSILEPLLVHQDEVLLRDDVGPVEVDRLVDQLQCRRDLIFGE